MSQSAYLYVCKWCGEPAPDEWGTSRRCPKHPDEAPRQSQLPPYMRECEFCPVPAVARDEAVAIVMELREAFAPVQDPKQDGAMARSYNWLIDNHA